jgi:hypothetical protein
VWKSGFGKLKWVSYDVLKKFRFVLRAALNPSQIFGVVDTLGYPQISGLNPNPTRLANPATGDAFFDRHLFKVGRLDAGIGDEQLP